MSYTPRFRFIRSTGGTSSCVPAPPSTRAPSSRRRTRCPCCFAPGCAVRWLRFRARFGQLALTVQQVEALAPRAGCLPATQGFLRRSLLHALHALALADLRQVLQELPVLVLNLHEPVLLQLSLLRVHDHVLEPGRRLVVHARLDLLQLILGDLRASLLFGLNPDAGRSAGRWARTERGRRFPNFLEPGTDGTRGRGGRARMEEEGTHPLPLHVWGRERGHGTLRAPPVPPFTRMASVKVRKNGCGIWSR